MIHPPLAKQFLLAALVAFTVGVLVKAAIGAELPRPAESDRETKWSAWYAQEVGGIAEYRCEDGSRVDTLTDTYAVEVEWCRKWPEAVGQSVLYSILTNRKPMIVLLRRYNKGEDEEYLQCLIVCTRLDIATETIDVRKPKELRARE